MDAFLYPFVAFVPFCSKPICSHRELAGSFAGGHGGANHAEGGLGFVGGGEAATGGEEVGDRRGSGSAGEELLDGGPLEAGT